MATFNMMSGYELPTADEMEILYQKGQLPPGILPPSFLWKRLSADTDQLPADEWDINGAGVFY